MKRFFLLALFGIFFSIMESLAIPTYRVIEIRGTVQFKGKALRRGSSINDNDILYSSIKSIVKVTDGKRSYTLRVQGKMSVKELILNVPDVYEVAVNNIRRHDSNNMVKRIEYSMATMGREEMPLDLHENEAVALCKEDSTGNLTVTFMRFGMEKPLRYTVSQSAYNQLLRIDIITSKGHDYAYSSLSVYDALWKPIERYIKEGDIFIYSTPVFLSDIDMTLIPVSDKLRMGEVYEMISVDGE